MRMRHEHEIDIRQMEEVEPRLLQPLHHLSHIDQLGSMSTFTSLV
jgi:hypothetical protein